jgi:hypothetical protein
MTWGLDVAPNPNDYTKKNANITCKIRKMTTPFISESHDNYRKPEAVKSEKTYIFNYLDKESIEQYKKFLFKIYEEKAREERNQTMYKEQFGGKMDNKSQLKMTKEKKELVYRQYLNSNAQK